MSPSEYEQLVEFLGRRSTEIDRRFDQVDGQIAELRRELHRLGPKPRCQRQPGRISIDDGS